MEYKSLLSYLKDSIPPFNNSLTNKTIFTKFQNGLLTDLLMRYKSLIKPKQYNRHLKLIIL